MGSIYIVIVSAFPSALVTFIRYITASLLSLKGLPRRQWPQRINVPNVILKMIIEDTINSPFLSAWNPICVGCR